MNPFDYFVSCFRDKYADFNGRARRSEYWYFVLFNFLAAIALAMVDGLIGYPIFYAIYALGSFIPSLAVAVRRLHDTNKSGWWLLIALVPILGGIALLVFLCTDSNPGENQFGLNPKNPDDEIARYLVE